MITKVEIDDILGRYEKGKVTIGTLGSHSALNIFKGEKKKTSEQSVSARRVMKSRAPY